MFERAARIELRGLRPPRSVRRPSLSAPSRPANCAPAVKPAVLIRARVPIVANANPVNRGARIRTGDLCDPNAALYRTEPRPGPTVRHTDSGVGVFQTTRRGGIELRSPSAILARLASHRGGRIAYYPPCRSAQTHCVNSCGIHVGSNREHLLSNNGRGGIRTHAGVSPHDFQSCALSHSATRPGQLGVRNSGIPHHLHLLPGWD